MNKTILLSGVFAALLLLAAVASIGRSGKPISSSSTAPASSPADSRPASASFPSRTASPSATSFSPASSATQPVTRSSPRVQEQPLTAAISQSPAVPANLPHGSSPRSSTLPPSSAASSPAALPAPAPVQPEGNVDGNAGGNAAVWELPDGFKPPAAFMPLPENASAPAATVNEQIAQDFEQAIDSAGTASPDGSTEVSQQSWNDAQSQADEQYRALFGENASNQKGFSAALQTISNPAATP